MSKHIFIVDDDQAILEVITIVLKDEGYTVTPFSEYNTLFSAIKKTIPDLLLLDVSMPGQNGKEITKKLKDDSKTKDLPIVIVSAKTDIAEIAKEAGANDFLEKPFEIEQLLAVVSKYIQK